MRVWQPETTSQRGQLVPTSSTTVVVVQHASERLAKSKSPEIDNHAYIEACSSAVWARGHALQGQRTPLNVNACGFPGYLGQAR